MGYANSKIDNLLDAGLDQLAMQGVALDREPKAHVSCKNDTALDQANSGCNCIDSDAVGQAGCNCIDSDDLGQAGCNCIDSDDLGQAGCNCIDSI
jgi:hypothetical protein